VALRDADLAGAASLLQEHLQANPGDAEAWLTLSEIQLKLGDFGASKESRLKGREAGGG
jgi:cytochrome c-type biogenesis protein CcmH/NrfG